MSDSLTVMEWPPAEVLRRLEELPALLAGQPVPAEDRNLAVLLTDLLDIAALAPQTGSRGRLRNEKLVKPLEQLAQKAAQAAVLLREISQTVDRPPADVPLDGQWAELKPRLPKVLRQGLMDLGVRRVRDLTTLAMVDLGCLPRMDAGIMLRLHALLTDLGLNWAEESRVLSVDGTVNARLEPMMDDLEHLLASLKLQLDQYARPEAIKGTLPLATRQMVIESVLVRIRRRLNAAAGSRVKELLLTMPRAEDVEIGTHLEGMGLTPAFCRRVMRKRNRLLGRVAGPVTTGQDEDGEEEEADRE